MRRAHVLAGIGIAVLAMVAGCSGRPNDLRHYADQEQDTTTASTSPTTTLAPTSTVDPVVLQAQASAALLGDLSAADIGFHPKTAEHPVVLSALPTCSVSLGQPEAGGQTGWVGATPATTLSDYVAVYQGTTGATVLAAAKSSMTCTSYPQEHTNYTLVPFALPQPPTGVDSFYSWCERAGSQLASCSVLLAKGPLLARAQVVTTTEGKAENLIGQVAGPVARALTMA